MPSLSVFQFINTTTQPSPPHFRFPSSSAALLLPLSPVPIPGVVRRWPTRRPLLSSSVVSGACFVICDVVFVGVVLIVSDFDLVAGLGFWGSVEFSRFGGCCSAVDRWVLGGGFEVGVWWIGLIVTCWTVRVWLWLLRVCLGLLRSGLTKFFDWNVLGIFWVPSASLVCLLLLLDWGWLFSKFFSLWVFWLSRL